MKKIIYFFSAFWMFCFTSCDFLDTNSPSESTPEVIFKSVTSTEYSLMGCYSKLVESNLYGQSLSQQLMCNSDIEFVSGSAIDIVGPGDKGLVNYNGNSNNTVTRSTWTDLYVLVERSNLVIEGINNGSLLSGGTAEEQIKVKAFLGEAITLRALAYMHLVRLFGDVPYKTTSSKPDLSNVYAPPTDRDTIMQNLIKDLKIAENYLPWIGEYGSYSSQRISKAYAKGLCARIALMRGGYSIRNKPGFPTERGSDWEKWYQIARDETFEVWKSGKHSLNPDFVNIWKNVCSGGIDTKEVLFQLGMGFHESGVLGYNIGIGIAASPSFGYGTGPQVYTSSYYFYSFDKKDFRRMTACPYQVDNTLKEVLLDIGTTYTFGKWDCRWFSKEFKDANLTAKGRQQNGVNYIEMRYSEILLMFAEADNALNHGPTDNAKQALTLVRNRAFAETDRAVSVGTYINNLTNEDQFFNAIVNERAWEFGGENIRKWDLVRWNLLVNKLTAQRDVLVAMHDLTKYPVTIFDKTYTILPGRLFYKYNSDGLTIDMTSVNFYEDWGVGSVPNWLPSTNTTYTSKKSLYGNGTYTATIVSGINAMNLGILNNPDGVVNRHLFPLNAKIIADSNGTLFNSYGFK